MSSEFPSLLQDFLSSPEMDEFLDITIESKDGQKHEVAKILVAVHSNVLHKIFIHEPEKTTIHLPTVPGNVLDMILFWMESGELLLSWKNVQEVLKTAEFLEVPDVSVFCHEWIMTRMSTKKVLGIWTFAKDNFLKDLEKSSLLFICSKFTEVYKEEEFANLPPDSLSVLLSSDLLTCGEEEVWEGMKVWLNSNDTRTEEEIATVMETLRLGLLEHNFFFNRIQPLLDSLFPNFNFRCNASVQPRFPDTFLFTFGGWSGSGPVNTISVFNPSSAKWINLSMSLPSDWAYLDTAVVDTNIFLCGGHFEDIHNNGQVDSRVFMKFDPNTMEISRLSKMKERRNFVSLATTKESIYAIGGKNNQNQRLNSVEMYSISRNQWYMVRPMNKIRSDAGAATLKGNIYAVGGFDGVAPTNTVEMFSPNTGKWTLIKSMKTARSGVKVVAVDGLLYVVGGWDGTKRLTSGEVYNPETKEWTDLPDMMTPRSNHSLAVVQGKLVAIGGYTGTDTTYKVEMLNLNSNSWEMVSDLPSNRSALSSCVVPFIKLGEESRNTLQYNTLAVVDYPDIFMEADESSSDMSRYEISDVSSTDNDSDVEVMMLVD